MVPHAGPNTYGSVRDVTHLSVGSYYLVLFIMLVQYSEGHHYTLVLDMGSLHDILGPVHSALIPLDSDLEVPVSNYTIVPKDVKTKSWEC